MNTKTLVASLAFGLVSASSFAAEAVRTEVPVSTLDRAVIRAEIERADAAGELNTNEAYGSFSYATLHGRKSTLTREAVIAEMSLPKWQALMAAPSEAYNVFGDDVGSSRDRAEVMAEGAAAAGSSRGNYRLFVGG